MNPSIGPLILLLPLLIFTNAIPAFSQAANLPKDWYCDPRREMNLLAGTVLSIAPYVKNENYLPRYDGYRPIEIVEFQLADIATGKPTPETRKFMNVAGRGESEYGFKPGEKYLFDSTRRPFQVEKDGPEYYFIRPSDYARPFAEAGGMLDFLRSIKNLNEYEEVLGVGRGMPVHKSFPGEKARHMARPIFPEELKKAGKQGSARVLVLLDEDGKVVKAKAVCTAEPGFGEAAEKAALASTFSPLVINGKPVRSVKTMIFSFSLY